MTWNPPSNVSTGNALTAALWNNFLGTYGSLQYLYDTMQTLQQGHELTILRTVASSAIPTNGNALVSWDYVLQNQGFTLPALPFTSFTVPATGMYLFSFSYLMNVSTNLRIRPYDSGPSFLNWSQAPTTAFLDTVAGQSFLIAGQSIDWRLFVTTSSTLLGYNADASAILRVSKIS